MEQILRDRIESCMEAQGINLLELSRRSGVAYSTLQGVMSAKSAARVDTVEGIAKGLGESVGSLLGFSNAVTEKERELDERLRLLNLIPRLNREQVHHFLTQILEELPPDGPRTTSDSLSDEPKKA